MASIKPNTTSANDATGGFKTVAFGFDKSEVTLYIASLRKKIKQTEEEFEEKLAQALENPAASSEALKHEREVIRSEMEKMWGEKLNERNAILKQQQARIQELESKVNEDKDTIESLKTQLSAVTSESGTDSAELTARAAKAYMQFTSILKSMSGSIDSTLMKMQRSWRGEFEEQIAALEEAQKHTEAPKSAETQAVAKVESVISEEKPAVSEMTAPTVKEDASTIKEAVPTVKEAAPEQPKDIAPKAAEIEKPKKQIDVPNKPEPAPEPSKAANKTKNNEKKSASDSRPKTDAPSKSAPVKPAEPPKPVISPMSFDDLLAEDDPLKGIIADLSEDTSSIKPKEPVKPKAAVKEEKPASQPEPVDDISSEFGDLLAESSIDDDLKDLIADTPKVQDIKPKTQSVSKPKPDPAPKPVSKPAPKPASKIAVDDDLSSLLAEPYINEIKPIDNTVGEMDDFAELLSNEKDDFDSDLVIDEADHKVSKGEDLDVGLVSDMVLDSSDIEANGDLGQMIQEQNEREMAEFGNFFISEDSEDSAPMFGEETEQNIHEDDDNPFNFSFTGDGDDDDDMSTDASFPGMI